MQENEIIEILKTGNLQKLTPIRTGIQEHTVKKERKVSVEIFNQILLNFSLSNNDPRPIGYLLPQSTEDLQKTLAKITERFVSSHDVQWYETILLVSSQFVRKNHQSTFFAGFIHELINKGIENNDPSLITIAINLLMKVSFRKYRAELIAEILPQLINWCVTRKDMHSLKEYSRFLNEISDASKESQLHSDIAKAVFSIGIYLDDFPTIIEAIRFASQIPQKVKRYSCNQYLFENLAHSAHANYLENILQSMELFSDLPESTRQEIIHATTTYYISQEKDCQKVNSLIHTLEEKYPTIVPCIVISLLENAEKSGERWYYDRALTLTGSWRSDNPAIIKQYVRTGIKIAEMHNDPDSIERLLPLVSQSKYQSRIYLLFSKTLLKMNEFNKTIAVFSSISSQTNFSPQMIECAREITKYAILHEKSDSILGSHILPAEPLVRDSIIRHALIEICKENPFDAGLHHSASISRIAQIHSSPGAILLEAISILIDQGFLDQNDPTILIKITQSLSSQTEREQAISSIIVKIAETGIKKRNRDYLQRAVGLSCLIEDVPIRSRALSTIIDDAAHLAAEQGDLNLLQRMKEWSLSLLDQTSADFAITNIINGMIQYGLTFKSLLALEEAYTAAEEIHDSTIKMLKKEHLAEHFVKIGCILLSEAEVQENSISPILRTFSRSLEILKDLNDQSKILKISGYIDIVLTEYSNHKRQGIFTIPLSFFILSLEDPMERDAMVRRVVSHIADANEIPDSSDPYVVMIRLLREDARWQKFTLTLELSQKLMAFVSDPFSRITGICVIAEEYHSTGLLEKAESLLVQALYSSRSLTHYDQRAFTQIEIARISAKFDLLLSKRSLDLAIESFFHISVESEKTPIAERIVQILAKIDKKGNTPDYLDRALSIASDIPDPIAYSHALITVSGMPNLDIKTKSDIIQDLEKIVGSIKSPYEQSRILLDLIPHVAILCDGTHLQGVLREIQRIIKLIKIPFISQHLVNQMVQEAKKVSDTKSDPVYYNLSLKLASELYVNPPVANKDSPNKMQNGEERKYRIEEIRRGLSRGKPTPQIVSSLEQNISQIQDRGERASSYGSVALVLHETGQKTPFLKFLQLAKSEAAIVRPLSRRAYLLCDLSLRLYSIGEERQGKDFFDQALQAATNIRQYSLRDEVFEDLGMAMSVLQEIAP
ncbi:MAG: hypothetical protein ABFC24_05635 [Methanoregulaceae archaeon]